MSFRDTRSEIVHRRTYSRPLDEEAGVFETLDQTTQRIIDHQQWLWERALGRDLNEDEISELDDLYDIFYSLEASPSGRTRWLGGTDVAKHREASQFNCSYNTIRTPSDVVDAFWLLLQGCGVGFSPQVGVLRGFHKPVKISVQRSHRLQKGGRETTRLETPLQGHYTLSVGDSAEAWAKSIGKLLTLPADATRLLLDFSEIRPSGERLSGYGWISSGDGTLAEAYEKIAGILNNRHGKLLNELDILDVLNLLGTTLSSRRSAEIALLDIDNEMAHDFIEAKKDHWIDRPWRGQSNNSVVFWDKPSRLELEGVFAKMVEAGGSEPGFINGAAAKKRAPWFKGVNPCAEILLGDSSFCNLVEIDLAKFGKMNPQIIKTVRLVARANYRQTCVNFKDGVLQPGWHESNDYLRLMGVGITGIAAANPSPEYLQIIRAAARDAAKEMADELGLPYAKAVTTVKPSGTLSKVMSTTEGVHKPLGKYLINNVKFSINDPLVPRLKEAGYRSFPDPYSPADAVIFSFPVCWDTVDFDIVDGKHVNLESAVKQLDRYKMLMDNYVDHNCSVTISYDPSEVKDIIGWLLENWDTYVGVSWIFRNDPTKTAEDLGYPYLPQEVITQEEYEQYVATLGDVNLSSTDLMDDLVDEGAECATGSCPVR